MKPPYVLHVLFVTRRVCSRGTNSAGNRPVFNSRKQAEISSCEKSDKREQPTSLNVLKSHKARSDVIGNGVCCFRFTRNEVNKEDISRGFF